MQVYEPGQPVRIGNGSIPATLVAVAIYAHGGVLYEVAWWVEGVRYSEWLSEREFTAEQAKVSMGFKSMNGVHGPHGTD